MDRQSAAFLDATEADWFEVDLDTVTVYVAEDEDTNPIVPAEYYDESGWDEDRMPAKTRTEAAEILAVRIVNPDAPETQVNADAYDVPMNDNPDDAELEG